MSKFRVLALLSGGKDSCYSTVQCVAEGHQIVAAANLAPADANVEELDSYMFQTAAHSAVETLADAMGVRLFRGAIRGSNLRSEGHRYDPTDGDEVEDLFNLIKEARAEVEFDAVCSGAILSDYQRIRVENICSRLGLTSLSYLWRRDQSELLQEMIDSGMKCVLVKCAAMGLDQSHLGKSLQEVQPHLEQLKAKYGINVCGEGGEYETFTLDAPIFRKTISIESSEVLLHSDDAFAPVAILKLKSLKLTEKQHLSEESHAFRLANHRIRVSQDFVSDVQDVGDVTLVHDTSTDTERKCRAFGGSEIAKTNPLQSTSGDSGWFAIAGEDAAYVEGDTVANATQRIFHQFREELSSKGRSFSDLVSVTLFVRNMSDYAAINSEYVRNFGQNPPVRGCAQADVCAQSPLLMTAIGHRTSESEAEHAKKVMHVQSLSHWAPASIGPYSQVAEVNGVIHLAGQIGLIPGSMSMAEGVVRQTNLSLRHVRRLLEAKEALLVDAVQATCFVSKSTSARVALAAWNEALRKQIHSFGPDQQVQSASLNVLVVPGLPRNAEVEWQVVAVRDAHKGRCKWHSSAVPISDGSGLELSWAVQSPDKDEETPASGESTIFFTAKLTSTEKDSIEHSLLAEVGRAICARLPPMKASGSVTLFHCAPMSDNVAEVLRAAGPALADCCVACVASEMAGGRNEVMAINGFLSGAA